MTSVFPPSYQAIRDSLRITILGKLPEILSEEFQEKFRMIDSENVYLNRLMIQIKGESEEKVSQLVDMMAAEVVEKEFV